MNLVRAALALAASAACGTPEPRGLVLLGGTLIDGTGAPALADAAVVIAAGRIVDAGPRSHVRLPKGVPIVDTGGRFLVPWMPASDDDSALAALAGDMPPGTPAVRLIAAAVRAAAPRTAPIQAGQPARILILAADPTADLRGLRAVHRRVVDGRLEHAGSR